MPIIWSEKARAKLDGNLPLRQEFEVPVANAKPGDEPWIEPGEKILEEVTIGISQINEAQRKELERDSTPINVRNYPDIEYYNGEPVELVGKIAVGTKINNVLLGMSDGGGYAAFRLRDIQGDLVEMNQNSLQSIDPDTICAVHYQFIEA